MPHDTPLITTLISGLVLAFILGAIAHRLRLPPLVGYLVAGMLVGPHTPGFVADMSLAPQLAEIGVILLMFGVGLHFSLRDLLSVRGLAVPGALAQITVATAMGGALGWAMGWPLGGSLVFGLSLSVASTVVLLKALQERRLIETERGKIAVGWLIVEDLAMVLALVIIPAVASIASGAQAVHDPATRAVEDVLGLQLGVGGILFITVLKVAAFVVLMLVVGRKLIPWSLQRIAHMGSKELFRLGVLAIALGVAFGAAQLFGVSLALGAFFAGMILSESELSQRAAQESLPLRDAFAVLFFVSVGMLFDPGILLREPGPLLITLFIIVLGKSIAAFVIVLSVRNNVATALTISASLAQIGEFSFILAELGVGLELFPPAARDLILAGAILSIILNPAVFYAFELMRPTLERRLGRGPAQPAATAPQPPGAAPDQASAERASPSVQAAPPPQPARTAEPAKAGAMNAGEGNGPALTALSGHTILVGFGRVGGIVGIALRSENRPFLVMEEADMRVAETRAIGIETIAGNAADAEVLALANPAGARHLIIAIPDTFEAGQIAAAARRANPQIHIVGRASSDAEVDHLIKLGAEEVIMGEREIARAMIAWIDTKKGE